LSLADGPTGNEVRWVARGRDKPCATERLCRAAASLRVAEELLPDQRLAPRGAGRIPSGGVIAGRRCFSPLAASVHLGPPATDDCEEPPITLASAKFRSIRLWSSSTRISGRHDLLAIRTGIDVASLLSGHGCWNSGAGEFLGVCWPSGWFSMLTPAEGSSRVACARSFCHRRRREAGQGLSEFSSLRRSSVQAGRRCACGACGFPGLRLRALETDRC